MTLIRRIYTDFISFPRAANHDQRLAYKGRSASCIAFPFMPFRVRSPWVRDEIRVYLFDPYHLCSISLCAEYLQKLLSKTQKPIGFMNIQAPAMKLLKNIQQVVLLCRASMLRRDMGGQLVDGRMIEHGRRP